MRRQLDGEYGRLEMSEQATESREGSYIAPRLEHALVADAMRHGILSCSSDASLRAAARTMTLHHIHTVVVNDPHEQGPVGVVADRDLIDALAAGRAERTLAELADQDFVQLSSGQRLQDAVATMRERGVDHAVVIDAHSGRPTGMLSTLDILGVYAWGEA